MKKGDKMLIIESVLPEDNTFNSGRYTDVIMLVCTKGKERTGADFKVLLNKAGLH